MKANILYNRFDEEGNRLESRVVKLRLLPSGWVKILTKPVVYIPPTDVHQIIPERSLKNG